MIRQTDVCMLIIEKTHRPNRSKRKRPLIPVMRNRCPKTRLTKIN